MLELVMVISLLSTCSSQGSVKALLSMPVVGCPLVAICESSMSGRGIGTFLPTPAPWSWVWAAGPQHPDLLMGIWYYNDIFRFCCCKTGNPNTCDGMM